MNSSSKLAVAFILMAGFIAAQTTPASARSSTSASVIPEPSSQGKAPDLTFKPNPGDEPPQPPPATPSAPDGTPKPAPAASANTPPEVQTAPGKGSADNAVPKAAPDEPLYVLGPNDVVSVTVFDEKNVPGTYSISQDGRMSVPLIGDFTASGLTIPGLQAVITKKLSAYIIDPVVNVQLLRNNSKKYTLIGGVLKSGPFPLLQTTTILDAIAAAGGFKDFANPKKIVLRRGTKVFNFNYKDVIRGKHMEENIAVEDGDIIYVPE